MAGFTNGSPLGMSIEYVSEYAPGLLFPIARELSRQLLPTSVSFYGVDIWTGYELSWLNLRGKPQVALAEFRIPCTSEFIVESKSFKLYLNSLNQTRFDSTEQVLTALKRDLSAVVGAQVEIELQQLGGQFDNNIGIFTGECIDDLDVEITSYHPAPELLAVADEVVDEALYTNLLKTNCPVTGQPDWASIYIQYKGRKLVRENLLRYIISFREHQDFHEHCVERIFTDIMLACRPEMLNVYARYTRRGGLDINPFRTTLANNIPPRLRLIRQ
jgi:7-cyano-7-deazaguanine reductase